MDSISELLSSVSPEELERLKGVAQSLISSSGNSDAVAPPKKEKSDASLDGISSLFGGDTAKMLTTVAKALNQRGRPHQVHCRLKAIAFRRTATARR